MNRCTFGVGSQGMLPRLGERRPRSPSCCHGWEGTDQQGRESQLLAVESDQPDETSPQKMFRFGIQNISNDRRRAELDGDGRGAGRRKKATFML